MIAKPDVQTDSQKTTDVLRGLHARLPDVHAMAVFERDGSIVMSGAQTELAPERLGALCATLMAVASHAAQDMLCGNLRHMVLQGDRGVLIAIYLDETSILAMAASAQLSIGRLLLEARKVIDAVVQLRAMQ